MKKLFILFFSMCLLTLSCSNKKFLASELIGKWINEADSRDYFLITEADNFGAPDNNGTLHYVPITPWRPNEKASIHEFGAGYGVDAIRFRFTSPSYCEVTYSNMMEIYRK